MPVETEIPEQITETPDIQASVQARSRAAKPSDLPTLGRAHQGGSISWVTTIFMAIFHILALTALFFFTWKGLIAAVVLYVLSINVGIGMCYHRLLTHRGYKVPRLLEYALAVCGTLALEGGPIFWVGTHRVHHQLSDHEGDPHSPTDGTFWAHMGWIMSGQSLHAATSILNRYAPDLSRDKFYVWLSKYHWVPLTTVGLVLLAWGGWPAVLWGIFLRVTLGLHATWLVNSATHLWGSRRFETRDESRNNWWVALLTGGEGWHNNHHAPFLLGMAFVGSSLTPTTTASGC
jgi:fatty-acid desaturase